MGFLTKLGLRVDTGNGPKLKRQFRTGWPAQTREEIKFFETPKVQYRYRERPAAISDAQTIVFSADPPVTLEVYDELFDIFSQRYRVIVVEFATMGFSATNADFGCGFREANDDLVLFLRAVAGPGAIWAFSCVAGLAAVDLAARHPELCSQLILMQTGDVAAFDRWKKSRDTKGLLGRPIIGQLAMKKIAPKRVSDWYNLSVGKTSKIDHFCACASEALSHGALWSLASAFQVYMTPSIMLAPPPQPILSLWGRKDGSHPQENELSSRSFSDKVTQVSFDNLGHFSELEDPMRVYNTIGHYLDQRA